MKSATIVIFGACLLGGCEGDEDETLGDYIDDSEIHLDELRAEVESHHEDAENVETLTDLQNMEDQYLEASRMHLNELGRVRGHMGGCNAPQGPLGSMQDFQDMCDRDLDRHRDRIRDCSTLEEAIQEENRHRQAMMSGLNGFGDAMHGLMMTHGHNMCGS